MSTVKTSPSVENIVAEIQQLSDEEQRTLAAAVLQDRLLESFVEELEDQLNYEKAVAEGSAELFND
jgi:hypothetical protein